LPSSFQQSDLTTGIKPDWSAEGNKKAAPPLFLRWHRPSCWKAGFLPPVLLLGYAASLMFAEKG
jgi:hypothetical protein